MISFARGLILRKGMRELEFERQIEHEKVQFKFLDTHEVMTFNLAKLYKQIQEGEYAVVTSQYQESPSRQEDEPLKLPSIMTKAQEALIAFRLKFVLAAIRNRVTRGAIDRLSELLTRTEDFVGIDDEETRLAQKFKKPSVWTLRRWIVAYEDSGSNPYVLLDRRAIRRTTTRLTGDQSTRIQERVEVDHTLLDVWVLDPRLGIPLGRPWVTVLIDRYSGYIQGMCCGWQVQIS